MYFRSLTFLMVSAGIGVAAWTNVAGTLRYVTVAGDGTVWGVGANSAVYRRANDQWQTMPGLLMQISAGSAQNVWGVNTANNVYKWNGSNWDQKPGLLKQVSAAADGTVWGTTGDDSVFRWDAATNNWILLPGKLRVVSVGTAQEIWGVNAANNVFRWNGSNWDPKPGLASTIAVGSDKTLWALGVNGVPHQWDPAVSNWIALDGGLAQVSVGNANNIWGVNSGSAVFMRAGSITVTQNLGTGTIVTTGITPIATPSQPIMILSAPQPGQLLCSMSTSALTAQCGTLKAEYVGGYVLNTKCDKGFYDMIYGGACWDCNGTDDGHGSWLRSTEAVDKDRACFRSPSEYTSSASKVKSTLWAWECAGGSFWDGYGGGGCWTCPAETPRRTAAPVYATNACASPVSQEKPATLLKFNGCPNPNPVTMKTDGKLKGKALPGKPFLDIAGGWSQGSASGGCYTCPIVDTDGNFLISERNGAPIYGENSGCTTLLKYKPATFVQPGLAGLPGVKSLIFERQLLDSKGLLIFLHSLAVAKGLVPDSAPARAWVGQQLSAIASSPFGNDSFRTLMLGELSRILATPPAGRTPSEAALLGAVERNVNAWRVYVAQQKLDMYDAWKAWDVIQRTLHKRSMLVDLFDYGTVPLDFQSVGGALAAPAAVGAGLGASIAAGQGYVKALEWVTTTAKFTTGTVTTKNTTTNALYEMLTAGRLLSDASKGVGTATSAIAGSTAIAAVFAVLTQVATDQFIAIVTARPKLLAALAEARNPVTLESIYTGASGADKIQYYWMLTMDTAIANNDAQLVQLAAAANQTGAASGYAVPAN